MGSLLLWGIVEIKSFFEEMGSSDHTGLYGGELFPALTWIGYPES